MKPSIKTLTYATWLAYLYMAIHICLFVTKRFYAYPFIYNHIFTYNLALQLFYFLLFVYLTNILVSYQENPAAIRAFKFYAVCSTLVVISYLITIAHWPTFVSSLIGVVILISIINMAVQVRKINHPVLAKYYKILLIMMVANLVVTSILPVGLNYLYGFLGIGALYRFGLIYSDLFKLFIPIAMLLIFHNTAKLLRHPEGIQQPVEEYV